jgi:hypothetical protein
MNVKQLRDKLNKLIEEGKGDYIVFEDVEGIYELNEVKEGFLVEVDGMWSKKIKEFYLYEDIDDETYDEEYRQKIRELSKRADKINGIKLTLY